MLCVVFVLGRLILMVVCGMVLCCLVVLSSLGMVVRMVCMGLKSILNIS